MAAEKSGFGTPWEELYGPNLGYVQGQYEQYLEDPESVEAELKELFERWGAPPAVVSAAQPAGQSSGLTQAEMKKVVAAVKLADNIRTYGHLAADIYPINGKEADTRMILPEHYGLTEADLRAIPAHLLWEDAPAGVTNGYDVIERLKETYTETIAYEFSHIHDEEELTWLKNKIENVGVKVNLTNEERVHLLKELTSVEGFEKFLHKTFVGQKRFSIEGVDALVPMLNAVIEEGLKDGTQNVLIGMAHRGRLNVLTHVLKKPYHSMLAEFNHSPNKNFPSDEFVGASGGWTGDVKYHLGGDRYIKENGEAKARVTLANNPSHLEVVDPVIEGYARAAQDDRKTAGYPKQDISKAFAIMVHGDAAFSGEGVVPETLNMSRLKGYQTGGTIHVITNNLIGFTTESDDDRSTRYSSDLAKGFEIPIVHVNADDPESCIAVILFAYEYRKQFKKDFLIDLIGYRRFGHNEMDDPSVTQPLFYEKVNAHPTVRTVYAEKLVKEGVITEDEAQKLDQDVQNHLQAVLDEVKADQSSKTSEAEPPAAVVEKLPEFQTAVDLEELNSINDRLLQWPEGFTVYPKLEKILQRRANAVSAEGKIDWGHAETLAFASILKEGTPIRITGQDTERGTFAHRHLVLHDPKTGKTVSPLHQLDVEASFDIHNSPLTETAVLGFEYGYNVFAPETLVLWEAQYGDFANTAQVMFDQFVSASRAKWGQKSGLVMLLPHGFEGAGPEHSSARLERYLQLAAENNWIVANLSSAGQYFHILRRQAALLKHDAVRPLVIVTPKALLRHPLATVNGPALSEGRFQPVMEQEGTGTNAESVERLILASGKVTVDLAVELQKGDIPENLHIVRVEQLYPFPSEEIKEIVKRYKNLKEIVWVQEEPKNMGAWSFVLPRLTELAPKKVNVNYIGRPDRSAPATGEPDVHKQEQETIVKEALNFK
ncbi:MAG: 2-oxoglutarate dehydrogenase E1 component [Tuberibacillus sp.]